MPLSHFDPEAWNRLAPAERIAQCRRMAEQLQALSKETFGDEQLVYRELARAWNKLARQLERSHYAQLS